MSKHWNTEEKMKEFNIENLERKNIYSVPEDFFSEMQRNVLQEVSPKKEAKVIRFNWAYAAAAAVATIFGVTFYMNQDDAAIPEMASVQDFTQTNEHAVSVAPEKVEARMAYQTLEEDLTLVVNNNQKDETQPEVKTVSAKTQDLPVKQNPEVQVDQILGSITSAELADLGRNVEQDVYLDLYY